MKPEYKSRGLELISSVDSRVERILEMLQGTRPADPQFAIKLTKEIQKTLEQLTNIIEIS
jgi:hypothetical protein